jgi:anti-anti-sigma regulatory factor
MGRRESISGQTAAVPAVEVLTSSEAPRIDLIFRGTLNAGPVKQALQLLRDELQRTERLKLKSPKVCIIDATGVSSIDSKGVSVEMRSLLEYIPLKIGRHLILVSRNQNVTMFMRAATLGCGMRFYPLESRAEVPAKVSDIQTLTSAVDG